MRKSVVALLFLTLIICISSGCSILNREEPTPESSVVPTNTLAPEDIPPSISVAPIEGDASEYLPVTIQGRGFQPGEIVKIMISFHSDPHYWNEIYAEPVVKEDGTFIERVIMPTSWPDGSPIVERELVIVAVASDGTEATALFINSAIAPTDTPVVVKTFTPMPSITPAPIVETMPLTVDAARSEAGGIALRYPVGWEALEMLNMIAIAPNEAAFEADVPDAVMVMAISMNEEEMAEAEITSLEDAEQELGALMGDFVAGEAGGEMAMLSSERIKLAEEDALSVEFSGTDAESGAQMAGHIVIAVLENRVVMIMGWGSPDKWEEFAPTFAAMLDTVELFEPTAESELEGTAVDTPIPLTATAIPLEEATVEVAQPTPTTPAPQGQATIATPGESRIGIAPLQGDLAAAPVELTVEGTSFPGFAQIEIYLSVPDTDKHMKVYEGIQTEADGHFLVKFNLPTTWENGQAITEQRVRITAQTPEGKYYGWVMFFNAAGAALAPTTAAVPAGEPVIEVSPDSGDLTAALQQVTVRGRGFSAGETVNIYLTMPGEAVRPKSYGSATSGANGEFEVAITLPQEWEDGTSITEPDIAIVAVAMPSQAYAWYIFNNQ